MRKIKTVSGSKRIGTLLQEGHEVTVPAEPDDAAGSVEAKRPGEPGRRLLRVPGVRHHRPAPGVPAARLLPGHETRYNQQEIHSPRGEYYFRAMKPITTNKKSIGLEVSTTSGP